MSSENSINFKSLRQAATTVLQGEYPVVVDKVVFKFTQKNNEPMWAITLKVTAGPFTGRSVTHYLVLSSEHQFLQKRFFSHMKALGADDTFMDANPSPEAICAHITGRHAVATFKESEQEFRGEKREEVENLVAAQAGGVSIGLGSGVTVAASLPKATAVSVAPAGGEVAPPEEPF